MEEDANSLSAWLHKQTQLAHVFYITTFSKPRVINIKTHYLFQKFNDDDQA